MSIIANAAVFLLGVVFGSFLNVVVIRYGTGRGFAKGRSECASCGKKLKTSELIPIASFIFLKGRCSSCKSRISWQYPAVELVTGLLFLFSFIKLDIGGTNILLRIPELLTLILVWCFLIVISVYDIRHKIIPDFFVFTLSIVALLRLIASLYYPNLFHLLPTLSTLDFLAGPLLFLPFFFLWIVSKGRWMGLGDGKLSLGIGWLLGISGGTAAVMLGFWIGAVASILILAVKKIVSAFSTAKRLPLPLFNLTMGSEIPFAPFLVIGTILAVLLRVNVSSAAKTVGLIMGF